jgi:hypothetical protein
VIFDPASRSLPSVNDPLIEPTLEPSHEIVAVFIVALEPAAERLPPAVASDIVPLPLGSRPLFPGPAACAPGATAASASMLAEASQPARRMMLR